MERDYFPLQPLLFWQSLSLFWFCGLLAAKYPLAGFTLTLIFIFIDRRLWRVLALFVAVTLFCCGFFAIKISVPKPPDKLSFPAWTVRGDNYPIPIRIEGKVRFVQSLADKRLRVILQDVHALNKAQTHTLPGYLVWTWDQKKQSDEGFLDLHRPLVGQNVRITARIRSTDGFLNFYGSDIGSYWQSQNVFWRIWTQNNMGEPEFFGESSKLASMREYVRIKFAAALTQASMNFTQSDDYKQKIQALAFLPALLLYERYALNQGTLEKMQGASLYHSLALSGQHLTFIIYYAFFIVFCIRFLRPHIFLYLPSPKLVGILSFPLAFLYLWLGNAPISLIRASIMLFVALFFFFRQKVFNLEHILLYATLCITIYHPMSFYNVGLQLSVLCVGSICLMLPWIKSIDMWQKSKEIRPKRFIPWHKRLLKHIWLRIIQLFLISLGIQVILLPIFLLYFPPSGIWFISNVFWLPVLGFWVLPLGALGLLVSVFSFQALAVQILTLAALPCQALLQVLQWMQDAQLLLFPALVRPHFAGVLAWIPLCLAMGILVKRISRQEIKDGKSNIPPHVRRLCILGACLLCIGPLLRYAEYWHNKLEVTLLDVGQGQAVHIRLPGGHSILIDGGGSRSKRFDPGTDIILPSIVYNKVPHLWAAINTHPDLDHLRGLMYILPHMDIEHFYHNGTVFSAYDQELWDKYAKQELLPKNSVLYAGMKIPLPSSAHGDFTYLLEVLSPQPNATYKEDNNSSLIMRLVQENRYDKKQRKGLILLCADAEKEALQDLILSKQELRAEILILPHHGAKDALLPEFYALVSPKLVLVSAGRQNSFGHPHKAVRMALQKTNIPLKNTAQFGAIRIIWKEIDTNFKIMTAKSYYENTD